MNILIVQPYETFATADLGDGFADGFKDLGHNVYVFESGAQLEAKRHILTSFGRINNLTFDLDNQSLAMEGFFDQVVVYDIDIIFSIRGTLPPFSYLKKLKKLGVKTVLYNTEDPYDYEFSKQIVPHYDYVLSNDPIGEKLYKNCKWIPVAGSPHVYKVLPDAIKYYDLSFVGTFFKERVEFFDAIYNNIKDLKLYLAGHWVGKEDIDKDGDKFGEFGSVPEHRVKDLIGDKVNRVTSPSRINSIMNSSKIVPNPHRDSNWIGNTIYTASNFNPRVFEASLAGAFQLVSGNRKETIRKFFEKDEIVVYDSIEQFIELLNYYLSHDDERIKIVEKARLKVLEQHTYKHRCEEVLDFIN